MDLVVSLTHKAGLHIVITCISTLAWSLSFYPQPILNTRRKSTIGSTVDFPTINVLGFLCYAVSTSLLLYSPLIRAQYAARNPISPEPAVRGNDLAFAVHAAAISGITWSMYWQRLWGFEQRKGQKVSQGIIVVGMVCLLGIGLAIVEVWVNGGDGRRNPNEWTWIDVVSISRIWKTAQFRSDSFRLT